MKRRWVKRATLLMVLGLLLGTIGCGKDDGGKKDGAKDYSDKVSFSCTTYYSLNYADAGYDLAEDEFYEYICDKFNVEIDAWSNPGGDESTQIWINGGTLPDMFTMNEMSHLEVTEYADMGAIKPLPDDWKERWPNLAKMVKDTGAEELFSYDGKLYMIPHATFGNFAEVNKVTRHTSLYYRKDWAKQVGMESLGENGVITVSEMFEYFDKVKAAGLCSNSYLGANMESFLTMIQALHGINYPTFYNDGNEWKYTPALPEYEDVIAEMRQWKEQGRVNPNFTTESVLAQFQNYWYGQLPACLYAGTVGEYSNMIDQILLGSGYDVTDMEQRQALWDIYGMAAVASDDGTVMTREVENYWLITGFSANCSDEAMERILDMTDYFCTDEGEISSGLGIQGKHWDYDKDGKVEMIGDATALFEVSPSRFFFVWGYGDDFMYNKGSGCPGVYDTEVDLCLKLYDVREQGKVSKLEHDYYMMTTDSYRNFSVSPNGTIGALIYNKDNINTEWAKFLKNYESMYSAVLKDLNK